MAQTHERLGQPLEALKVYKETIDSIEVVRRELPLSIGQPDFFKDKRRFFTSTLSLLYDLHLKNPGQGYDEDALFYVEKYRTGYLKLRRSQLDATPGDPQRLAFEDEYRAVLKDISAIRSELRESGLASGERNGFLPELEKAEERYKALLLRRVEEIRGFIRRDDSAPLSCDQIQERLSDGRTGFVEYFSGEEHSFALFVSSQRLCLVKLADEKKIREAVGNYLQYLRLKETGNFQGFPGGQRLLNMLLGPILDELGPGMERLVIILDDHLHYLPFESLAGVPGQGRAGGAGARFLVEDLEISYAPSISWWLRRREHSSSYRELQRLLIIGYSNEDAAQPLASGSYLPLPALRFVRREVDVISGLFKQAEPAVLLDQMAGEAELQALDLAGFDVIHFATHGVLDNEYWWRSYLLLEGSPALRLDGFLSPLEILDWGLNARLVVLSACQTAKGRLYEGEGILGISQAFLLAGAESVIASLWNVNDESSVRIFRCFYRHLKGGEPISRALRLAKLDLIDSRLNHPFYWAGFILMGNGGD
jgi:CHAT domain-containing protein